MANAETTARRPVCAHCAYDRSGLSPEARCPECGGEPEAVGVEWLAPMPSRARILALLTWPAALALPLAVAIGLFTPLAWPFALLAITAGVGGPILVAGNVAFGCARKRRREGVFIRLLAIGWIFNLTALGSLVALLLYLEILA